MSKYIALFFFACSLSSNAGVYGDLKSGFKKFKAKCAAYADDYFSAKTSVHDAPSSKEIQEAYNALDTAYKNGTYNSVDDFLKQMLAEGSTLEPTSNAFKIAYIDFLFQLDDKSFFKPLRDTLSETSTGRRVRKFMRKIESVDFQKPFKSDPDIIISALLLSQRISPKKTLGVLIKSLPTSPKKVLAGWFAHRFANKKLLSFWVDHFQKAGAKDYARNLVKKIKKALVRIIKSVISVPTLIGDTAVAKFLFKRYEKEIIKKLNEGASLKDIYSYLEEIASRKGFRNISSAQVASSLRNTGNLIMVASVAYLSYQLGANMFSRDYHDKNARWVEKISFGYKGTETVAHEFLSEIFLAEKGEQSKIIAELREAYPERMEFISVEFDNALLSIQQGKNEDLDFDSWTDEYAKIFAKEFSNEEMNDMKDVIIAYQTSRSKEWIKSVHTNYNNEKKDPDNDIYFLFDYLKEDIVSQLGLTKEQLLQDDASLDIKISGLIYAELTQLRENKGAEAISDIRSNYKGMEQSHMYYERIHSDGGMISTIVEQIREKPEEETETEKDPDSN